MKSAVALGDQASRAFLTDPAQLAHQGGSGLPQTEHLTTARHNVLKLQATGVSSLLPGACNVRMSVYILASTS